MCRMEQVNDNRISIRLPARIDANSARMVEKELLALLGGKAYRNVVLNALDLDYISSAGLRVVLRVRKEYGGLVIQNVAPDVYEIFRMTGFTNIMGIFVRPPFL